MRGHRHEFEETADRVALPPDNRIGCRDDSAGAVFEPARRQDVNPANRPVAVNRAHQRRGRLLQHRGVEPPQFEFDREHGPVVHSNEPHSYGLRFWGQSPFGDSPHVFDVLVLQRLRETEHGHQVPADVADCHRPVLRLDPPDELLPVSGRDRTVCHQHVAAALERRDNPYRFAREYGGQQFLARQNPDLRAAGQERGKDRGVGIEGGQPER